jgi:hypothetical protein
MRRAFGDALISIGALAVLLLTLVAVDDRVREQVSYRFEGHTASGELADAGAFAKELATVVFDVAREQSISHAPMMIFVVVATVLVLFMLRT